MWVVVGRKVSTDAVADGERRTLPCPKCRGERVFVEHRERHAATLFWIPLANYQTRAVFVCSVCRTGLVEEGEAARQLDQVGTVVGGAAATALVPAEALRQRWGGPPSDSPAEAWARLIERLAALEPDHDARTRRWQERRREAPGVVIPLEQVGAPTRHDLSSLRSVVADLVTEGRLGKVHRDL